jgi:hypothetical protein
VSDIAESACQKEDVKTGEKGRNGSNLRLMCRQYTAKALLVPLVAATCLLAGAGPGFAAVFAVQNL